MAQLCARPRARRICWASLTQDAMAGRWLPQAGCASQTVGGCEPSCACAFACRCKACVVQSLVALVISSHAVGEESGAAAEGARPVLAQTASGGSNWCPTAWLLLPEWPLKHVCALPMPSRSLFDSLARAASSGVQTIQQLLFQCRRLSGSTLAAPCMRDAWILGCWGSTPRPLGGQPVNAPQRTSMHARAPWQ